MENKNKIIELKNITKQFGGDMVLDHISLDIHDKEFLTLLGPSGCGKTTTLRIIGGFTNPDSGDVMFNGKRINDVPPHKRELNTIFQKYALFPHLNVFDNIAFGLRVAKTPKKEIERRVMEMIDIVELEGFEKRNVERLSGGQQQRVAIARALVNNPKVLLLDEPLGALDLKLRKDMQIELKKIQRRMSITFVYVTHDQEEALTMSDTVVVMNEGKIQQIGTPQYIYNEPVNAFVANFIGESNILPGIMHRDYFVEFAGSNFDCLDKGFGEMEEVDVVVRPEDIELSEATADTLNGIVETITFKGVHYEMIIRVGTDIWLVHSTKSAKVGEIVAMNIAPDCIHVMKKSAMPKINRYTLNEEGENNLAEGAVNDL
ncbi:MAG: spermidine/putrescine ABC transporter ATP-binding protein [Eubacteriales bacterium]|jgi:spermidine/putrescine transport system ATP-binding protein